MKEIRYLCSCGASNWITPSKKLRGEEPARFFCCVCGKPSYDICIRCQWQSPAESGHAFCQGCGTGREEIQQGATKTDVWLIYRQLRTIVLLMGVMMPFYWYIIGPWIQRFSERRTKEYLANPHKTDPWTLWFFVGGNLFMLAFFSRAYVIRTLYALFTGRKRLPTELRTVEIWLHEGGPGAVEETQRRWVRSVLRLRARGKAIRRAVSARLTHHAQVETDR